MKKKISVVVNTYNEEENVEPIAAAILAQLDTLPKYDYELIFIDNCSTDATREKLRGLCRGNPRVKAIFNAKNFGAFRSLMYGILQAEGDCVIKLSADFQDPVEMIPRFVEAWEEGHLVVCGIKTSSRENRLVRFLRTLYYRLIRRMSEIDQIDHFTGFGLYDREFVEVMRDLKDPTPFIRGIVAEFGYRRKDIPYEQAKRKNGKSHFNWYRLYDAAMLSFTSYTKGGMRVAIFAGAILAFISIIIAVVYLVMKLMYWDSFSVGTAPILLAVLIFGSVQLLFIGLLGEYTMSINTRVMNRPLVIEEARINFEEKKLKGEKASDKNASEDRCV